VQAARARVVRRFIPTCVGSICRVLESLGLPTVHPHVRGEHFLLRLAATGADGSSPRAWGACDEPLVVGAQDRFIPTCVGA